MSTPTFRQTGNFESPITPLIITNKISQFLDSS